MIAASLPNVFNVLSPAIGLQPAMGWDWWLPPNYSVHGRQIDILWNWVFWITSAVGIAVLVTLALFCVQYRHRPDKAKGVFTHGNTRLEMIWTLIPAVILILISLFSKRVWDNYRYNPGTDPNPARIMVIGQQFKWNVIYPGPDNKLGRYLIYPKTTDLKWPDPPPGEEPWPFPSVPGPAYLPEKAAREELNKFIENKNPLGKDFSDPDGRDDDWQQALNRPVYLPKNRAVEIHLSSRDVIHDFFAPNFRVKLDAVPGTRGMIYLTATRSSAEFEQASRHTYSLVELQNLLSAKNAPEYRLVIPEGEPNSDLADPDDPATRRYYREVEEKKIKTIKGKKTEVTVKSHQTVLRSEASIAPERIADLQSIGLTRVLAYVPQVWDVVCEQLCGAGHYTMKGQIVVLEPEEYKKRFETPPPAAASADPVTPPASASAAR